MGFSTRELSVSEAKNMKLDGTKKIITRERLKRVAEHINESAEALADYLADDSRDDDGWDECEAFLNGVESALEFVAGFHDWQVELAHNAFGVGGSAYFEISGKNSDDDVAWFTVRVSTHKERYNTNAWSFDPVDTLEQHIMGLEEVQKKIMGS